MLAIIKLVPWWLRGLLVWMFLALCAPLLWFAAMVIINFLLYVTGTGSGFATPLFYVGYVCGLAGICARVMSAIKPNPRKRWMIVTFIVTIITLAITLKLDGLSPDMVKELWYVFAFAEGIVHGVFLVDWLARGFPMRWPS